MTLDALFQNNSSVSLWTSTPVAMAPDTQAWRIENGAMIVHAMNQTSNGGARCVRWEETIEAPNRQRQPMLAPWTRMLVYLTPVTI